MSFPAPFPANPIIDTDERRAVIGRLCSAVNQFLQGFYEIPDGEEEPHEKAPKDLAKALYDYLTLPCTEMERGQIAAASRATEPASYPFPKPSPETLIRATEAADFTRSQIGKIHASIAAAPEAMRAMMEAVLLPQFELQLRQQEEFVSQIQAEIEKPEPQV